MKLFTRKAIILFVIIVSIILISHLAWCTDVEGIINEDTTWDFLGSPYNIISEIQIAETATLTIEPGVVVTNGKIKVWGTLNAIGTSYKSSRNDPLVNQFHDKHINSFDSTEQLINLLTLKNIDQM